MAGDLMDAVSTPGWGSLLEEARAQVTIAAANQELKSLGAKKDSIDGAGIASWASAQNLINAAYDVHNTAFANGTNVGDATDSVNIALASFSDQMVTIGSLKIDSSGLNLRGTRLTDSAGTEPGSNAAAARPRLESAMQAVSMQRAYIGANVQNLTSYANSLGIQVEKFSSAFSTIKDANIADEVVSLTKFQILNMSGIAALGQSNNSSRSILSLLR
jgi:flagellin